MPNNPFPQHENEPRAPSLGAPKELDTSRERARPGESRTSSVSWIVVATAGVILELVGAMIWLSATYRSGESRGQVVLIAGFSLLAVARLVQAATNRA